MAAIDFPNSPTLNQQFTSGDKTWVWNGSSWLAYRAAAPITLSGTQTLTNKTISGSANTLSDIPESAVTNLTSDLSAKETPAGAQSKADAAQAAAIASSAGSLATHESATTSVHGISNTANLVYTGDSRLTDTRTPTDGSVSTAKVADGAITSAKIADATIVDADISSSAAIAQSKISGLTSDLAGKAPLASPGLTGVPTAPTATAGTSTTQIATTAFATTAAADAAAAVVNSAPSTLDTLNELASALGNDANFSTSTATALGNRVRVDAAQTFDSTQKSTARSNIDAVASTDSRLSDTRTPSDDTVTTAKIVDGAVTNAKLENSEITINGSAVALGGSVSITGLPTQTQHGGQFLTTDGTLATWTTVPSDETKAPLESPTFTGVPAAPTPTVGADNTQIATTAFVTTALSGFSSLPTQTGNSGKYLTTDGTAASWNYLSSPDLSARTSVGTVQSTGGGDNVTTIVTVGQEGLAVVQVANSTTVNFPYSSPAQAVINRFSTYAVAGSKLRLTLSGTVYNGLISSYTYNGSNQFTVTISSWVGSTPSGTFFGAADGYQFVTLAYSATTSNSDLQTALAGVDRFYVGSSLITSSSVSFSGATVNSLLSAAQVGDEVYYYSNPGTVSAKERNGSSAGLAYDPTISTWKATAGGQTGNVPLLIPNTTSPNSITRPEHALTPASSAANVDICLSPKGQGSFSLRTQDGLVSGGNKRGVNAVDLQLRRAYNSEVAAGQESFAAGAQNTVSGTNAIALGLGNYAYGNYSVALGGYSNASGTNTTAIQGGTAGGTYTTVINNSLATGSMAVAINNGSNLGVSQSLTIGSAQVNRYNNSIITVSGAINITANSARVLRPTGSVGGVSVGSAAEVFVIPSQRAWLFTFKIVASDGTNAKAWKGEGLVKKLTAANTTAFVGTPTVTTLFGDTGLSAAVVAVAVSTTYDGIYFTVNNGAASSVSWTLELTFTTA